MYGKDKIEYLLNLSNEQDIYPQPVDVEYDFSDDALPEPIRIAKRLRDYMNAQNVYITKENTFTGLMRFNEGILGVPSDIFTVNGHTWFHRAASQYYGNDGVIKSDLIRIDWQHSTANFEYILKNGIRGSLEKIAFYKEKHRYDKDKYEFLVGMEDICNGLLDWAKKCSDEYFKAAENESDVNRKEELLKMAEACKKVPLNPATSFFEGIQSMLFCFICLADGIGTLDRYMFELYDADIKSGKITREQAKYYLQELFIYIGKWSKCTWIDGDTSAENHFVVGGYNEQGEDGFNDLSKLIIESLMGIDTRRPQISLRWTPKTPFETLKFVLDCERNDKNKRIAFVNDEPRIKGLMKHCDMTFSDAIKYTMTGCNEIAFPGAIWKGGSPANIARCLNTTLYKRTDDIVEAKDFEEFYAVFREELEKDIDEMMYWRDIFDTIKAKDWSMLSNFLIDGCIENAIPVNRGGCTKKLAGIELMGITCVIDSLSIIKQFVFDEKRVTLKRLIEVMDSNWEKDTELHTEILNSGRFFGNNDPLSDDMARRFTTELYTVTKDRRTNEGAKILFGSLAGYVPYYTLYAETIKATPDGRYDGEAFMVGNGQINGKDSKGLLPLMKSIAEMDPEYIMTGAVVCNMMIDDKLIRSDKYFEQVCKMIETYFKLGGLHVQLNYVSTEMLIDAKKNPEKYKGLKVRVSGWSGEYVKFLDCVQDEIIARTCKN